ncbi:MAG: nitronate monooxygenase [Deltaproteobacteria bacterium]|nr:nitronate monooxygenase [Deltaproteobacteria bacterium]
MLKTRITEALNIQHPIIQGGMQWISKAELTTAVSNAGGLGIMTALSFSSPEDFDQELKKAHQLTDKPFGVNLTFLPSFREIPYDELIDVIISNQIKIIETAGRNPEAYIGKLHRENIKVLHKCTSLKHALKAEAIGCDFVGIDGYECAGHPGEDDVTSLILLPLVSKALKIPVVASGGYADGRGLIAALALGAEAVLMGTRFLMTKEAPVHDNIKQTFLKASEKETLLLERTLKNSLRVYKNRHAQKVLEMELNGAGLEELAPLLSGMLGLKSLKDGLVQDSLLALGQVVGLIDDIPSVKELIDQIIETAMDIISNRFKAMTQ